MSADPTIVELTGQDEAGLRAWAEVAAASSRHEVGPNATPWAAEELLVVARRHDAERRRTARLGKLQKKVVDPTPA